MNKMVRVSLSVLLLVISLAANVYSRLAPPRPPKGSELGVVLNRDGNGEPRVTSVNPRGPAANALQVGDEVIAINNVKISDDHRFLFIDVPPGTTQTLTLRRAGVLQCHHPGCSSSARLSIGEQKLRSTTDCRYSISIGSMDNLSPSLG